MNEAVVRSAGVHGGFDIDVQALRFAVSPEDVGRFNVRKLLLAGTVAARLLGIGYSQMLGLVQTGVVPSVVVGRHRMVPRQALLELADSYKDAAS